MQTHRLVLTLEAPLAVSRARDTSNRYALPSAVPPTTLRGALAAAVEETGALRSNDGPSMASVFGPRGCRTSSLLPSDSGLLGEVSPGPLTLRTCKRHGGLHDDGGHGVQDVLLDALLFARHDNPDALRALQTCDVDGCSQVLTDMDGALGVGPDQTFYRPPVPDRQTQAHVGLDRRRQGAASGILYSRELISEKTGAENELRPTRMQADVTGPSDVMDALAPALRGSTLRVGTARSRGLGRCRVEACREVSPESMVPAPVPLPQRIEQFNECWSRWCEAHNHAGDGVLLTMTLRTPGLFVDAFLRPSLSPDGTALLQAGGEEEQAAAATLAQLEKVHQLARPVQVHAWNGMAEFPHRSAQGLVSGSVLVFKAEEISDELLRALRRVEHAGIGLRRHFGFGRVRVCDPTHTHLHEHKSYSHA